MREILFRAKRKDNREWIEGGYAEHDGKYFIVLWTRYIPDTRDWDTVEYYENNPCYNSTLIEVIPETVCQYTGLTGKNGKRIFEGDIINDIDYGIMKCIYLHGSFAWYKEDGFKIECMRYVPVIEVIGNIFNNPELISEV